MKNQSTINDLQAKSLVRFSCNSIWNGGIWTVQQVTEKAFRIDDQWFPKSQICHVSLLSENKFELVLNKWFDDKLIKETKNSNSAY